MSTTNVIADTPSTVSTQQSGSSVPASIPVTIGMLSPGGLRMVATDSFVVASNSNGNRYEIRDNKRIVIARSLGLSVRLEEFKFSIAQCSVPIVDVSPETYIRTFRSQQLRVGIMPFNVGFTTTSGAVITNQSATTPRLINFYTNYPTLATASYTFSSSSSAVPSSVNSIHLPFPAGVQLELRGAQVWGGYPAAVVAVVNPSKDEEDLVSVQVDMSVWISGENFGSPYYG